MPGQFLLPLGALSLGALSPATLPIRVPVSDVAANETSALALTGGEVRIMDGAGLPLGRFPRASGRATSRLPRRARASGGFAAGGVLADDDFNDPHDPDADIEDPANILVEDDSPARRRARALPASSAVAFAVGPSSAWVGRADGLWRLATDGAAERVALPVAGPVRQLATTANGRSVVAALDGGIVWSDDGGARFERMAEASAPVSRLVVIGAGPAYALAGQALLRLERGAPAVELVSRGVEDVTACGASALALIGGRLTVLAGTVPARQGRRDDDAEASERSETNDASRGRAIAPTGTERLACSPDGLTWVAYGATLWTSEDRGRTWKARDDLGGAFPITAVAVSRVALWVAGRAGLAVIPLQGPSGCPSPATDTSARGAAPGDAVPSPVPRWRWWLSALPRVDLGLASGQSSARREVRAFVLLSFTFDPGRDTRGQRGLDADAREVERREAAQRGVARRSPGEEVLDPIAAEERAATSRLLD